MQIKLKTKAKKQWSRDSRKLVMQAAQYASDYLGLWASETPLTIILRDFECATHGDSLDMDYKCVVRLSRKGNWIKTLFHEMEHIRQFVDDELELEAKTAVWQGRVYDRTEIEYADEPWEVEANRVEEELFLSFAENYLTNI